MKLFFKGGSLTKKNRKSTENPSVLDFPTIDALKRALLGKRGQPKGAAGGDEKRGGRRPNASKAAAAATKSTTDTNGADDESRMTKSRAGASCDSSFSSHDAVSPDIADVEWRLTNYDINDTEAQTMEQELKRLQVLQSYLLLDSDVEEEFDFITTMVSKVFDVPIALISLVDLGRQWFMSAHGLDAKETPRKYAFCAHVIQNVKNIMVVPDATKDPRFMNNPLVTGPPHVIFYAGAALVSPEGYKLGTLCIIDSKPRVFTKENEELLTEFALTTMTSIVERRERLQNQDAYRAEVLGLTCLDIARSLESVHKILAQLHKDVRDEFDELEVEDPDLDDRLSQLSMAATQVLLESRTCRSSLWTSTNEAKAAMEAAEAAAVAEGKPDKKIITDPKVDRKRVKMLMTTCRDVDRSLESVYNSLLGVQTHLGPEYLDEKQKGALATAVEQVNLKSGTCKTALLTVENSKNYNTMEGVEGCINDAVNVEVEKQRRLSSSTASLCDLFEDFEKIATDVDMVAVTKLTTVFESLNSIVAPLPNKVPTTLELRSEVPARIIGDDLLLFRSALNLLSNSMERTRQGWIHLSIGASVDEVIFSVEDTGARLTDEEAKLYFTFANEQLMVPLVRMVTSMGGRFGVRNGKGVSASMASTVFWFAIPSVSADDSAWGQVEAKTIGTTLKQVHEAKDPHSVGSKGINAKSKIMVGDPFQAQFIKDSCLGAALVPTIKSA